jgi:hypothetical protein
MAGAPCSNEVTAGDQSFDKGLKKLSRAIHNREIMGIQVCLALEFN